MKHPSVVRAQKELETPERSKLQTPVTLRSVGNMEIKEIDIRKQRKEKPFPSQSVIHEKPQNWIEHDKYYT